MTTLLNHTHAVSAQSWLASANGHADFPIQNLPIAIFRTNGSHEAFRGGVAIGDQVLDLAALASSGAWDEPDDEKALQACTLAAKSSLNDFMAAGASTWQTLRHALFAVLEVHQAPRRQALVQTCLLPQSNVEYAVPARIGDYTDFYTSIHHARNVGAIVRPDDPLTPNFQWLPIAYHGRASSVVISNTPFHRPVGQAMLPGGKTPVHGPCQRLDYELELGVFVGPGNAMGQAVALAQAEAHLFGVCLLNDWSARDIQFWEMAPLGPFSGKNFCTSISPWIVSMEALAPFRMPFKHPEGEPPPLAYLDGAFNRDSGALDIQLEVRIETASQREQGGGGSTVSRTSFRHQYWTLAQMLTQHTLGGCNMQPGDLFGTGTISGPTQSEVGAMVELTKGGREPLTLTNDAGHPGEQRAFLHDGDTVVLSGWCESPTAQRIGFGKCQGMVLPALPHPVG